MDIPSPTSEFNPQAWKDAYSNARLDPKLQAMQGVLKEAIDPTGQKLKMGGMEQMSEYWKTQEQQELELIRAELGDETFVCLKGENGEFRNDIAEGIDAWIVFQNQLRAYKEKGDYGSLNMLLSVFDDNSFLKKTAEKHLDGIKSNDGQYYKNGGYDPTPGKLLEVKRGHQFDMQPGIIDFRKYVENGSLDADKAIDKIISLLPPVEDISFEQGQLVNDTFRNIRKKFGDDVAINFHEKLEERYFKR